MNCNLTWVHRSKLAVDRFSRWSLCSDYLTCLAGSVSSTCPDDEPHWLVRNASTKDWLCDFAEDYLNNVMDHRSLNSLT